MTIISIVYVALIFLVFYAYMGYGILVFLINKLTNKGVQKNKIRLNETTPTVAVIIAAYNEKECLNQKVENSLKLDYPFEKLKIVVVTDGSNDGSEKMLRPHPQLQHFHQCKREGKMAAIERVIPHVDSEIIIFTDANAIVNSLAIKHMVSHFNSKDVGVVAGAKKIINTTKATSEKGEGAYWRYESFLKKQDSLFYSTMGAAGELYAIRRALYQPLKKDTLLDDFMMSIGICELGFKTVYEPRAIAQEKASLNIKEEFKRKVRIAAGGIQSISRLQHAINPIHNFKLFFQYTSHRVLRWTLVPWALVLIFALNLALLNLHFIYQALFITQVILYTSSMIGWYLEQKKGKAKIFSIPFYLVFMNYSTIVGQLRFLKKRQSSLWQKSERM